MPSSTLIWTLAQATSQHTFTVRPFLVWLGGGVAVSLFWFGSGVTLCLIELFLLQTRAKKYKFVLLIMGVSALIVAFFTWHYSFLQNASLQIAYWIGLSTASVIWLRPILLKGKRIRVLDATEARTLTELLPGQTGQVLYEGCLWQARTESYQGAIAPNQTVYVLRREGNTLIVLPENLFQG